MANDNRKVGAEPRGSPEGRLGPAPSAHQKSNPMTPAPSPRRRRLRAASGFTILEVTMATAVMALGIATSIVAMQHGFRFLDVARGTTLASQILQSEIERLRMLSWTNITAMAAATDTTAPIPSGSPAGVEVFDGATYFSSHSAIAGDYTITRTVALDAARPSDLANVTVSVQWRSYDGRMHQRSFQTKYMKNGLYDYYYTLARP